VYLHEHGFFDGLGLPAGIFNQGYLNDFLTLGRTRCGEVRYRISELLRHDNQTLRTNKPAREIALIHNSEIQMMLPVQIPNYTDFYSSEQHAFNVGSMFRDPKNALLPNWKHLPVGYHGRASSIVVSGTAIRRPRGQIKTPDSEMPVFGPTKKLDFELELAFITCGDSKLGSPISAKDARDHIFGYALFNDWSARDIQQWEYVPLGPFLGKNFGSVISPWIVTADALEPFLIDGPRQDPPVLDYLKESGSKNLDIIIEVLIQPEKGDPKMVTRSNTKYLYWNSSQQLAHHTINGCNIKTGDVYASGTISGPETDSFGSLLELTWNGQRPLQMADGSTRTFIEDLDTVIMRGYGTKNGVRVGFGNCEGKILPALN
jgi:fumarylacetoacetase